MRASIAPCALALAAAVLAAPLSAQEGDDRIDAAPSVDSASEARPASAARDLRIVGVRVDEGPDVDGVLDDPVWERAAVVDGFVQQEPDQGEPVSERTEVRVLYDGGALYLGVLAYDSDPDGIVATEMRRDGDRILDEDNFQVILDTFDDQRNGYMFVTTPLGAKLDQQISGEGGRSRSFGPSSSVNRDWDAIWYVETRRTEEGWVAEIAIPTTSISFPASDPQTWGINFMRNIRRKNEQAYWAPIPQAYDLMRVSLAGDLTDLRSLNRGMDLQVKPYVTGGAQRSTQGGVTDDDATSDVGLDLKYGVTAGLTLDVTVNTDFAQAEVDDERVNLTRFALFYPEKRDFFLENAGMFSVASSGRRRIIDLFFSRRIGLDGGQPVPIIGGARLTGKVGRNNIALMDIQTDGAFEQPGDNFLVARYSRDVFSSSRIGGIFVNKEATLDDQGPGGDHFNRTYGVDARIVPHPALTIDGLVARTASPGVSEEQMASHFRAGWLDRSWRIFGQHSDIEENFNAEVGFVPRTGIRRSLFHIEYNPRPEMLGIRTLEPMWNIDYTTDQTGLLLSRTTHQMLGVTFDNGGRAIVFYNDVFERLQRNFEIQPGIVIPQGSYDFGFWRFWYISNPAQRVFFGGYYSPQTFFNGDRTDVQGSLGVRITSQIAVEGRYTRNDVQLPAGDFVVDIGSLQLDLALSPSLSLRTRTQYNSSTEQWTTSARMRWIYRPGSEIFLVYDDVSREPTRFNEFTDFRDQQLIIKATYLLAF